MQITEALQQMELDSEIALRAPQEWPDPAHALKNLAASVKWLQERVERSVPTKPLEDVSKVWQRFKASGFSRDSLDRRQLRTLCASPDTAVRPELIKLLKHHPDLLLGQFNLLGVVNGYFTKWGEHVEAEKIETVIVNALVHPTMLGRSRVMKRWREARYLFTADAANKIASSILQKTKSAPEVWEDLFVGRATNLAQRAFEQAARREAAMLSKTSFTDDRDLMLKVGWLFTHLLTPELSASVYRECLAELIVSKISQGSATVRKQLVRYVYDDARLGDPRLIASSPNWREMPAKAKETFVSWLAEETLQFFFDTIVPKNDENRRRADYWLKFARNSKVRGFQVGISAEDMPKIRRTKGFSASNFARVESGSATAPSAFLMLFDGHGGKQYIAIEFSQTNHAAYIYAKRDFEKAGIDLNSAIFSMYQLKDRSRATDWFAHHIGDWESNADAKLREIGITA